jgi:glycerophosphoryl diester phosphodiesterase
VRPGRVVVASLVVACATYVCLAALYPEQRVRDHPYFDAPGTWVVAHRGGMALAPENTAEAFRRALALGADVLEMDLRFTGDGEIVLMHDETVDRTTDGTGRVADMHLAEIRQLDAGYRFVDGKGRFAFRGSGIGVPSFPQILERFADTRLNVEMKGFTDDQARALCGVLRLHDATARVLVSAFAHAPMAAFREACPEVATGATRREAIAFYSLFRVGLDHLFRSPALTMQLPLRLRGRRIITLSLLEVAGASNRPIQVWTVNDEADMERLLEMGVQAIITDRPDRLAGLMGRTRPGRWGEESPGEVLALTPPRPRS